MKVNILYLMTLAEKAFKQGQISLAYDIADEAKALLSTLATTANAPSNWRDIGKELEQEIDGYDWRYDACELWSFAE